MLYTKHLEKKTPNSKKKLYGIFRQANRIFFVKNSLSDTLWGELRSYLSALRKHHRFSYKLAEKEEPQSADVLMCSHISGTVTTKWRLVVKWQKLAIVLNPACSSTYYDGARAF